MIWTETKRKIAKNYCRTVLVLDDKIAATAEGNPEASHFAQAKAQFAENGILCDLRQIDKSANAESEAMRSCLRNSDVVVVDWYLGLGANKEKDPKESIAVLEQILKIGGERFVAIHSQETGAEIRKHLEGVFELSALKKQFQGEAEDPNVTPLSESETAPETPKVTPPEIFTLSAKSTDSKKSKMHPSQANGERDRRNAAQRDSRGTRKCVSRSPALGRSGICDASPRDAA
jgi:hypothetical protein